MEKEKRKKSETGESSLWGLSLFQAFAMEMWNQTETCEGDWSFEEWNWQRAEGDLWRNMNGIIVSNCGSRVRAEREEEESFFFIKK